MSPTQRTLAYMRARGYDCEVLERWNSHTRQRKDAWGFVDVICLRAGERIAIQCTAQGVKERMRKIVESPRLPVLQAAGFRVIVMGWRKLKTGWAPREIEL